MRFDDLIGLVQFAAYEGEGEGEGGSGGGTGSGEGAGTGGSGGTGTPPPKTFTQDEVNSLLAKSKREFQAKQQSIVEELEAVRTKLNMTNDERKDFETRLENYKNELLTKEELAAKEKKKLVQEHENKVKSLSDERDNWKNKFTGSTIIRSITDAAVSNKAYHPEQIVAILRPTTHLVEELDGEGTPSGSFVPKVKFEDTDKDGKPVTLELTVSEAVKRMKDMDKFLNLFVDEGTGGVGGQNRGAKGELDAAELAKSNPQKYRELRRQGKLKFKQ